jgi:hypothetical protein
MHPNPTLRDQSLEYKVESILDKCVEGTTPYYLVRWKNYGPEDNTWEPVQNLANANKAL